MKCFCKHSPCVNLVRIYERCKLIYTKEGFFEVVCLPKVCIKQRLNVVDKERRLVRVIIKVFNYERLCFENIRVVNEINPIPKDITINRIDGVWCYKDGILCICFPMIEELSVNTIDYLISLEGDFIESSIYVQDKSVENVHDLKIKKCKAYLKP